MAKKSNTKTVKKSKKRQVVIVDDHVLFTQSLTGLVNTFKNYEVAYTCKNGEEFINTIKDKGVDDIDVVLLDINMPKMNGIEVMKYLHRKHSKLNVIALSMEDTEKTVIRMLKFGSKGYLLKDIHPEDLLKALNSVVENGFYHSKLVSSVMFYNLNPEADRKDKKVALKEKEIKILQMLCTEMTYREIAEALHMSPKTIDNYRMNLFQKLDTKNRIGLVIYAIRNGIFKI